MLNNLKLKALLKESSSNVITAYHCGRDIGSGFDVNFIGTGEGLNILGPGIYFCDNQNIAAIYHKYHSDPWMYSCSIDIGDFYSNDLGTPDFVRKALVGLCSEISSVEGRDICNKEVASLKWGRGMIGCISKALGVQAGNRALVSAGISGVIESLPGGALEICVFDLSRVKVVGRHPIERTK